MSDQFKATEEEMKRIRREVDSVYGPARTVEQQLTEARKYRAQVQEQPYGNRVLLLDHDLTCELFDKDRCALCRVDFWGEAAEHVTYPFEYAVHLANFPKSKAICSHCAAKMKPKVKLLCDIGNLMEEAGMVRNGGITREQAARAEGDIARLKEMISVAVEKYLQQCGKQWAELDREAAEVAG
jgi:hypothetical protein